MNKLIFLIILSAASYSTCGFSLPQNAGEREILERLLPKQGLEIVPPNFQVDSPKHQYRTQRVVRGNFNADNAPDIAICAVKRTGPKRYDGYLIVASYRKGDWRLAFQQKFPGSYGPSLKWDQRTHQLFFFLSNVAKVEPLELLWDKRNNGFYLGDVDVRMRL